MNGLEEKSESRWWEFYFVRYAMGTVVGALLLYLLKPSFPELDKVLQLGSSTEQLAVYTALGLAYCYIASTPLLVIHTCRYNREPITKGINFHVVTFLLISISPIILIASYFLNPQYALSFLILFEMLFLFIQVYLLYQLRSDGYKKFTQFYKNLELRRSFLTSSLRDSYKHLREHGNSIAIVILEINLAAILYAHSAIAGSMEISSLWIMVGTIGLWIAPAAFVYLVGHELEYQLTN